MPLLHHCLNRFTLPLLSVDQDEKFAGLYFIVEPRQFAVLTGYA